MVQKHPEFSYVHHLHNQRKHENAIVKCNYPFFLVVHKNLLECHDLLGVFPVFRLEHFTVNVDEKCERTSIQNGGKAGM